MPFKRSPLKRSSPLKRGKPLAKQSQKYKERAAERKEYGEKMVAFFMEIWNKMEQPRRCFETGKPLPQEPATTMFHHCLLKSIYPEYAFTEENIVVILPEIHAITHQDIEKTPRIKQKTEELKQLHYEGKL